MYFMVHRTLWYCLHDNDRSIKANNPQENKFNYFKCTFISIVELIIYSINSSFFNEPGTIQSCRPISPELEICSSNLRNVFTSKFVYIIYLYYKYKLIIIKSIRSSQNVIGMKRFRQWGVKFCQLIILYFISR